MFKICLFLQHGKSNIHYNRYEPTPAAVINRAATPTYGVAHQYSTHMTYNVTTSIQGETV